VGLFSSNTQDELFIVGVPEEPFFDRENSQVGNFVGWSDLSWEIGTDFAGAVKESNAAPTANTSRPGATLLLTQDQCISCLI
jgi:hypothetical protein